MRGVLTFVRYCRANTTNKIPTPFYIWSTANPLGVICDWSVRACLYLLFPCVLYMCLRHVLAVRRREHVSAVMSGAVGRWFTSPVGGSKCLSPSSLDSSRECWQHIKFFNCICRLVKGIKHCLLTWNTLLWPNGSHKRYTQADFSVFATHRLYMHGC